MNTLGFIKFCRDRGLLITAYQVRNAIQHGVLSPRKLGHIFVFRGKSDLRKMEKYLRCQPPKGRPRGTTIESGARPSIPAAEKKAEPASGVSPTDSAKIQNAQHKVGKPAQHEAGKLAQREVDGHDFT